MMSATAHVEGQPLVDELEEAMASRNAGHRLKMLQRVSDLFMAGSSYYSDEQLALFDDVLMRLCAEIEVEARAQLARVLATADKAPLKLIRSFAFDDAIAVAAPVLKNSRQLSDGDLVENASTKSQDHLLAIAERLELHELVTDVLVERGDRRVLRTVARNAGARFSLAGHEKLTTHARSDRALAGAMLRRGDLPRQCFLKLLENASASVRAKLEAAMPAAPDDVAIAVNQVATTMSEDARNASQRHVRAMRDGQQRAGVKKTGEASVHAPASSHRFDQAVVALARLGQFPIYLVERALLDRGTDMILLLGKAAGCSWTTTKALLLMYPAKRKLSPNDLSQAFSRFERLSPQAARQVFTFHERRAQLAQAVSAPETEFQTQDTAQAK